MCHRFCSPPPGVAAPPEGGSAPRAATPFSLDLVEGELLVRAAEEPFALERPTTISGTHDTGQDGTGTVTAGVLSTPVFAFETIAEGVVVEVEVTLSQVTPASGTGVIDAEGNVTFLTGMTVELDISAAGGIVNGVCIASPVNIQLDSVAPYVPGENGQPGRVVLEDADFSVPPVEGSSCVSLLEEPVNELLGGGGHSLTMTMEGDLELPPAPGCPTLTDLATAPAGETALGAPLTLTATVEADPAFSDDPLCAEAGGVVPRGIVEFRRNGQSIGTAELNGAGVATSTTSALPAGPGSLTAHYRGLAPYRGSASARVDHHVSAPPAITTDLPEVIERGIPVEFDVTVTNTGFGSSVLNGRIDITFLSSSAQGSALELEYLDGTVWRPATRVSSGNFLTASLGSANGVPIAPGQQVTRTARLTLGRTATFALGPLPVTLELVWVDPTSGLPAPVRPPAPATVGRSSLSALVVSAERQAIALTASSTVNPHTVRQGNTTDVLLDLDVGGGGVATGTYRAFLGGQPVGIRMANAPVADGFPIAAPLPSAVDPNVYTVAIPVDAAVGERDLVIVYSGDARFKPTEWQTTVTVLPIRGTPYECVATIIVDQIIRANISVHANVPAVLPAGSTASLSHLDVEILLPRTDTLGVFFPAFPPVSPVGDPPTDAAPIASIDFTFGPGGTGTATAATFAHTEAMSPATRPRDPNPDMVIGFQGESGSVPIEGAPGDVIPITLGSFTMDMTLSGFPLALSCAPVGDALVVDEVVVSGTTLTVDAPEPTREGDAVTLTAAVAPTGYPGMVEFRSGDETLGVVPVASDGTATTTVPTLDVGTHELTARFLGGTAAVSTTSAPTVLTVLPETDCGAFAEDGHSAVVRLVYMELLRRCPDQAGFDYWVGRLEGGTSSETFARTIARTPEAVGVVVDDAYRTMLGRGADPAGRDFWVGRLSAHGRYDTLLADLAASPEFWTRAGASNTGFVTRVYERLLGRAPDQAGLDFWVGRLDGGTSPRTLVLTIANLDEPLGVLVGQSYDQILGRAPGSSERTGGIAFLRSTGDRSGLYAELIGRPEFTTRAQSFPNPED